ncbi:radical SAM protein [Pseudoalteromonas xiamenensis]|uniref:radical SAM protein n=1 Tax=Pseudoalteromonas xiamenensis TaxID=882626 RepID=UPI0035EE5C05
MADSSKAFIERIEGKPVLIWGARMTGMGLTRFLSDQKVDLLGFIDSDSSLTDKNICGMPVYAPSNLFDLAEKFPRLVIIIAVSIKEQEILKQIAEMGLSKIPVELYSDYCGSFYTIDIMGSCNLKCPSCAHGYVKEKYDQGRMSEKNFKQVVDKILSENEVVSHVSLYSWGEPFMHKNLPDFIRYLHEKNIAVALSSNLSIENEELISDVMRLSPEYLKVSLSGFYPKAYNRTHAGGNVHLVKSNLYKLKYYIDKYKSKTFVDVNYHLYKDNNCINKQQMQALCDELGFSMSTTFSLIMPLERCINHLEGRSDPDTITLNESLLVTVEEGVEATKEYRKNSCPFQENQININWDLSVPVCCTVFDAKETTVAKNFLDVSSQEINDNKGKIDICKKCLALGLPAYNMGFNRKRWEEIADSKISLDLQ